MYIQVDTEYFRSITSLVVFVLLFLWVDVLGGAMDDLSRAASENIQFVLGAMKDG